QVPSIGSGGKDGAHARREEEIHWQWGTAPADAATQISPVPQGGPMPQRQVLTSKMFVQELAMMQLCGPPTHFTNANGSLVTRLNQSVHAVRPMPSHALCGDC